MSRSTLSFITIFTVMFFTQACNASTNNPNDIGHIENNHPNAYAWLIDKVFKINTRSPIYQDDIGLYIVESETTQKLYLFQIQDLTCNDLAVCAKDLLRVILKAKELSQLVRISMYVKCDIEYRLWRIAWDYPYSVAM